MKTTISAEKENGRVKDIAPTVPKQLAFPFLSEVPGLVWQLPGGRWHAELCGGWWVCVAATRKAAIAGVKKAYREERER